MDAFLTGFTHELAHTSALTKLAQTGMAWLDKEMDAHKKRKAVAGALRPAVQPIAKAVGNTFSTAKNLVTKAPSAPKSKPATAPPKPKPVQISGQAKLDTGAPKVQRQASTNPLGTQRGGRMGAAQRAMDL